MNLKGETFDLADRDVIALRVGAAVGTSPDTDERIEALVAKARSFPGLVGLDLAKDVTCAQSYRWDEMRWAWPEGYAPQTNPVHKVVAIDYGAKRNILRSLASAGCDVTVLPATATAEAHCWSSRPWSTPTAVTMRPNSLKLARVTDVCQAVRVRNRNPASIRKNPLAFSGSSTTTTAATATSPAPGVPPRPIDRKKPMRSRSL